ncbi:hypothetical protein [Streptomyces rimosus]|uniref:hypothetical protein n=1 Tax=Streptomyces rimosus TaxID=1927 RepID=UPI000AF2DBBA|nr:hypothetical protein [Streptomyces rimosus]
MSQPSSLHTFPTLSPPLEPTAPLPLPPPCEVAHFAPVRARGGRHRLRRAVRRRRRTLTAGLAMTAAALAATAHQSGEGRASGVAGACAAPTPGAAPGARPEGERS